MSNTTGFVDTSGASLYFEQAGDGQAIFFVHAGVADLRMWDRQVEALQQEYNCIRIDMRGFGRTKNTAESYSPTADVVSVLDHLAVDAAHLVGLSMGGAVTLEVALEHRRRVRSLTLVAAGVRGWTQPPTELELAESAEIERAEEAEEWDRVVDLELQYWLDGPGRAGRVQGEVREKMRQMCRGAYDRGEPARKPTFTGPPAIERLGEVAVPVLVIAGTYDESSIIDIADRFAEQIPRSKKLIYEGVAHMVNLEEPDRFNSDLLEFLRESPR